MKSFLHNFIKVFDFAHKTSFAIFSCLWAVLGVTGVHVSSDYLVKLMTAMLYCVLAVMVLETMRKIVDED